MEYKLTNRIIILKNNDENDYLLIDLVHGAGLSMKLGEVDAVVGPSTVLQTDIDGLCEVPKGTKDFLSTQMPNQKDQDGFMNVILKKFVSWVQADPDQFKETPFFKITGVRKR